jgi:hypothetical protein
MESIMDFIAPQRHHVLLLKNNLVLSGASLGCNQFLKDPDGIIWIALNSDLSSKDDHYKQPPLPLAGALNHFHGPAEVTTSSLEWGAQMGVLLLF